MHDGAPLYFIHCSCTSIQEEFIVILCTIPKISVNKYLFLVQELDVPILSGHTTVLPYVDLRTRLALAIHVRIDFNTPAREYTPAGRWHVHVTIITY